MRSMGFYGLLNLFHNYRNIPVFLSRNALQMALYIMTRCNMICSYHIASCIAFVLGIWSSSLMDTQRRLWLCLNFYVRSQLHYSSGICYAVQLRKREDTKMLYRFITWLIVWRTLAKREFTTQDILGINAIALKGN